MKGSEFHQYDIKSFGPINYFNFCVQGTATFDFIGIVRHHGFDYLHFNFGRSVRLYRRKANEPI